MRISDGPVLEALARDEGIGGCRARGSFAEAEARLDAVRIDILIGRDQLDTPAGQAAALTAVATARKCFGRVTLVAANDAPLIAPLPLGGTLLKAARRLGARVTARPSASATHTIRIGTARESRGWDLRCWWDRWLSGTRALMMTTRLAIRAWH